MQELLRDTGPNLEWEKLCPIVDSAMQELAEPDREVILLRYFQNRPHAEIGARIGLGENAARMRVERALEKLRGILARRGVATSAGLAAVLLANAVGAAPAGLAGTITTAAALAGAATATTAIAATKVIVMTTLQKVSIAIAVATAVGAGIYGTLQASRVSKQAQDFQQQQTAFNARIEQLSREHDDASNRMAALVAENDRLRAAQKAAGILKLRGEVGSLRQSLSNAAAANQPATGLAKLMSDPAMRDFMRLAQLKIIKERYAPLVKELKLEPEQIEKFNQTISDLWMQYSDTVSNGKLGSGGTEMTKATDEVKASYDAQLKDILGDAGLARYNEFNAQLPAQTTVKLLNEQLADGGLNADQGARLLQVVAAEPYNATHGITGELDSAYFGSQSEIDQHLQQVQQSNQRIYDQAASFLNAQQLAALATLQSNTLNAQKTQGAALTQKH
jgi:hypothetical protein